MEAWFWRLSVWETGIARQGLSNLDFVFRSVVPFATRRFLAGTDVALEARIIFLFGRFMDEKNLSHSNKKVFCGLHSHLTFKLAVWAREFFDMQCRAARKAVDTWCLMACRINSKVNRDIRKKIGMMIWQARDQAEYDVDQKPMTEEETKRFKQKPQVWFLEDDRERNRIRYLRAKENVLCFSLGLLHGFC